MTFVKIFVPIGSNRFFKITMESSSNGHNKRYHPYATREKRNLENIEVAVPSLASSSPKIYNKSIQFNKPIDNGMQLMVGNVEQVAHWCRMLSFLPPTKIIYQVFGIMDSVKTGNKNCEKIFCLRNVFNLKSGIVCVFYEIDRELPKISKGKLVLCTGHVKGKNKLQIFAIKELHENDKNAFGKISSYSQLMVNDILKLKK